MTITPSADVAGQVTLSGSLTFDATHPWNVPQTITVTAVDDSTVEGPHSVTISHSATSSDPKYQTAGGALQIDDVTVNIEDNDPGVVAQGRTLIVQGSDNADSVTIGGGNIAVSVDGQDYGPYAMADFDEVVFGGGDGDDSLVYNGDATDETAKLWPDHAEFTAPWHDDRRDLRQHRVGRSPVEQGKRRPGRALRHRRPRRGRLLGCLVVPGLLQSRHRALLHAKGYEELLVDSGDGDLDTAELHGGANKEYFATGPDWATLVDDPATYEIDTLGFPRMFLYAAGDGDEAIVHDSPHRRPLAFLQRAGVPQGRGVRQQRQGLGRHVLSPHQGLRQGREHRRPGVRQRGRRRQPVRFADARRRFHGVASPLEATMTIGVGTASPKQVTVQGYQTVLAYATTSGGNDTAHLTDTSGNDWAKMDAAAGTAWLWSPYSPHSSGPQFDYLPASEGLRLDGD